MFLLGMALRSGQTNVGGDLLPTGPNIKMRKKVGDIRQIADQWSSTPASSP
jgi:hypothetical protein